MKYLLIIITSLLMSLNVLGQNSYPTYQYDSANHKMLVTFTLEQARMIDNDYDLLELLEKSKTECDSLMTSYQVVITSLDKVIASQEVKLKDNVTLQKKNDDIISNLNEQIKKYITDGIKCDSLVKNRETEISTLNNQIKTLKVHKITGYSLAGGIGGIIIAGLVYGFVSGHLVIK